MTQSGAIGSKDEAGVIADPRHGLPDLPEGLHLRPVRSEGGPAVLVLTVDPTHHTGFDLSLCRALTQGLAKAAEMHGTDAHGALVLAAAAGAALLGWPLPMPEAGQAVALGGALAALTETLADFPIPVVFLATGLVAGPAAALALACDGRVAPQTARLAFPEAGLGLCPAGGATQRLPRLIGVEQAARLMVGARPVGAVEALALGLLDRVVDTAPMPAALSLARSLAAAPPPRGPDRAPGLRDPRVGVAAIRTARAGLASEAGTGPASGRILDCLEAALLLPWDAALALEAATLEDLAQTPEAAALCHLGRAERRVQPPHAPPAPRLARLGVMGAAGAPLAGLAADAGLAVTLVDADAARLKAALAEIARHAETAVAAGRLLPAARDAAWARLTPAMDTAALAGCDLVLLAPGADLAAAAASTSSGTVLALLGRGAGLAGARAADVVGFQPAPGRLIEVIATPATASHSLAVAQALAARLSRLSVVWQAPGGVAARVMATGRAAGAHLATRIGAGPVAAALGAAGLSMLAPDQHGPAGAETLPAPQIVARVLSAMANAAAGALAQGLAASGAEIDLALVVGMGFPRLLGGPCHWADARGLMILRRDLTLWAAEDAGLFAPAPLLSDRMSAGIGLSA